jgi:hypothetical protein
MWKGFTILLLFLGTSSQIGCMSRNTCSVDIVAKSNVDGAIAGSVYELRTTPRSEPYKAQVNTILERKGLIPVAWTGQTEPNVLIDVVAEIKGPFQKTYTYYSPVFALRGGCCSCPPSRCHCSTHASRGYEIVDSIERTGSYEVYTRTLELIATHPNTGELLWETSTKSTGRTGDLHAVVPILLISCEPYIGNNTQGTTRVLTKRTNPAVRTLQEN